MDRMSCQAGAWCIPTEAMYDRNTRGRYEDAEQVTYQKDRINFLFIYLELFSLWIVVSVNLHPVKVAIRRFIQAPVSTLPLTGTLSLYGYIETFYGSIFPFYGSLIPYILDSRQDLGGTIVSHFRQSTFYFFLLAGNFHFKFPPLFRYLFNCR